MMNLTRIVLIGLMIVMAVSSEAAAPFPVTDGQSIYIVRDGDTLDSIARNRYGNRAYMDLIVIYNDLNGRDRLRTGTELRLPDLTDMMRDEGLYTVAGKEMKSILGAREIYIGIQNELWEMRRDQSADADWRTILDIPEGLADTLSTVSRMLRSAADGLGEGGEGRNTRPNSMIGQLRKAAVIVDELAQGKQDENGYDIDMVHQRIAHALRNAMIWAREGF